MGQRLEHNNYKDVPNTLFALYPHDSAIPAVDLTTLKGEDGATIGERQLLVSGCRHLSVTSVGDVGTRCTGEHVLLPVQQDGFPNVGYLSLEEMTRWLEHIFINTKVL